MENKLKSMFEYQRFENNERLNKLIQETESRYGAALSEEDLFFVNAAGVDTAWDVQNNTNVDTEE